MKNFVANLYQEFLKYPGNCLHQEISRCRSWRELHFLFTNISQEMEDWARGQHRPLRHSVRRQPRDRDQVSVSLIKCIQENKILTRTLHFQSQVCIMDRESLSLQIENMKFQAKMERWPLSKSIEA